MAERETPVERPYYEVTVRLPLELYNEAWFERVADSAGDQAAVSGSIVPELLPDEPEGVNIVRFP